jgi:hypothetical protein
MNKCKAWVAGEEMIPLANGGEDYYFDIMADGEITASFFDPAMAKIAGGEIVEFEGFRPCSIEVLHPTGRFDKDNDEIYAEDIIENTLNGHRFRIFYDSGRYKGTFIPYGNLAGGYCIDSIHKTDMRLFKIIGNKFENPELMGK